MEKNQKNNTQNNEGHSDPSSVIDIEKTGVFLSYQMLILLIGGLISLGITISVWNSYDSSIGNNQKDIKRIEKLINKRYSILNERIEERHDDIIKIIDDKYIIIERRVNVNNVRFKDWIKANTIKIEKLKEEQLKLKYSKP